MIPKFRAWYGIEMYDEPVICNGEFYLDWRDFEDGKTYDGAVLMQSIGIKDKNGVEIFEGDIVTASGYEYIGVGVVRYEESLAGFVVEFTNRLMRENPQFIYQFRELEVIGNIYENKEVLE